jgi:hypothetical protein
MSLALNTDYKVFFKNVKDQIKQAQLRASIKVNLHYEADNARHSAYRARC